MILEILLGVLAIGISCYVWAQLFALRKPRHPIRTFEVKPLNTSQKRALIQEDLDRILVLYQQGTLSEERYLQLADRLMDKMISLVDQADTAPVAHEMD